MSSSENSWNRHERRTETDRRTSTRKGKYDRRRNRCGLCRHFSPQADPRETCQYHHMPVETDSFACPQFEGPQGG